MVHNNTTGEGINIYMALPSSQKKTGNNNNKCCAPSIALETFAMGNLNARRYIRRANAQRNFLLLLLLLRVTLCQNDKDLCTTTRHLSHTRAYNKRQGFLIKRLGVVIILRIIMEQSGGGGGGPRE